MTDDPTAQPPRRPRPDGPADPSRGGSPQPRPPATPDPTRRAAPPEEPTRRASRPDAAAGASGDDPLAALERLQSLGTPGEGVGSPPPGGDVPRQSDRPASGGGSRPRPRPRPAASSARRLNVARIAAPAVFLVAVIVFISLMFQSGVIGGQEEIPVDKATPAATKTKEATTKPATGGTGGSATKIYVVKAGDTPSGIADKYGLSLAELEELNPDKDFTTLNIGEKVKVPKE